MAGIHLKIRLAREFGSIVQGALNVTQFREMVDRNKAEPDNSPICHSHDFIDSNVLMADAFESILGRECDPDSESDAELWSDAWSIAVAADFFA